MAKYVDTFIIPVPRKNFKAYEKQAKVAAKVWREHGALSYFESLADDVPNGKITSFGKSVKLKSGEVVVVGCASYKSRAHRDRVMKKVMSDPRLAAMMDGEMPFDGMRMFWGGFKTFVKA